MTKRQLKATSSAVRGSPSEKTTPSRTTKLIVSPSSLMFHDSATWGSHSRVTGSRVTRPSIIHC
jgi:hypothetical protein